MIIRQAISDLIPKAPGPDDVDAMFLGSAGTAETYTVPAGANILFINGTAAYWMRRNGTATIPTGEVTTGTAPALNVATCQVAPGDTLSFVSSTANCIISITRAAFAAAGKL